MTTAEHKLMIALFAKQLQLNKVITELLKSRGVVLPDDPQAFEFAVTEDNQAISDVLRSATKFYLQAAESLGINTGVTGPPE